MFVRCPSDDLSGRSAKFLIGSAGSGKCEPFVLSVSLLLGGSTTILAELVEERMAA